MVVSLKRSLHVLSVRPFALYQMVVLLRWSELSRLCGFLLLHKLNGGFTEAVLARPKCEAFCAVSDGGLTEMVRVISPVWILTMFSFVVVIVLVVVLVFFAV